MAKRFQITSLDAEGNVVETEVAESAWCISELDYHFDRMKSELYKGKIEHIIIDAVE